MIEKILNHLKTLSQQIDISGLSPEQIKERVLNELDNQFEQQSYEHNRYRLSSITLNFSRISDAQPLAKNEGREMINLIDLAFESPKADLTRFDDIAEEVKKLELAIDFEVWLLWEALLYEIELGHLENSHQAIAWMQSLGVEFDY